MYLDGVRRCALGFALAVGLAAFVPALAILGAAPANAGVEYVKVCERYGAGFYYIPGTDTCLKVGGTKPVEHKIDPQTVCSRYGAGYYYLPGQGTCRTEEEDDKADVKPVDYVKVCDAFGAGFFYIPGTDSCLKIGGFVRAETQFFGDRMGFATNVQPGNDSALFNPNRSVWGWGAGGSVTFGTAGGWRNSLQFAYSGATWGQERTTANGAETVGFVPGDANYGAGWSIGDFGSWGTYALTQSGMQLTYRATRPYGDTGYAGGSGPRWSGGYVLSLGHFDTQTHGYLESTALADYNFDVTQRFERWELGAGPTMGVGYSLGSGFFLHGSASLQGVIQYANFSSMEDVCFGCVNPMMMNLSGNQTSFGVRAGADAAIGYRIPGGAIKFTGGVTVGTYPVLVNRVTSAEGSDHITTKWGTEMHAGFRLLRDF